MRTQIFKAQTINAFFATSVSQMFGGSSQPPTTAERAVIKSLSTDKTTYETVRGSSRKRGGNLVYYVENVNHHNKDSELNRGSECIAIIWKSAFA